MKLGMKTMKLGVLVSCKAIKTTCHDDRSLMNTLRAQACLQVEFRDYNVVLSAKFFDKNADKDFAKILKPFR